ncbi:hypothetical protein BD779DRAFT_1485889 [Infundibulicybe gibba]|nr:hypothetical protein BD779DRAFT_1485889 [Infundibulicybe gibba]
MIHHPASIRWILNIKWIAAAGVQAGGLCIVQGIAKQIGDVGVALTFVYFSTFQTIIQRPFRTLTIAIHTCCILVFRWNPPSRTAPIMVSMIWIFIILIVAFGHLVHGTNYYGPTQYWCWITEAYPGERLGLEYIWLYLAGFVNLICYAAIALVIKGILIMDGGRFRLQTRLERELNDFALNNRNERTKSNSIAMQMLFYPAVYIVTVSPISIARWLSFSGKSVPFPATAFASVLFSSSGLLNVILFTSTRPKLIRNRGGMVTGDNDNGMHFGSRVSIRQRGRLDNRQIGPWKAASRTSSFTSSRTPTTAHPSSSQYISEGTCPLSS